ncbi:hypothetical protein BH11BAC1_BH11BAC1_19010 [soil metagenome]
MCKLADVQMCSPIDNYLRLGSEFLNEDRKLGPRNSKQFTKPNLHIFAFAHFSYLHIWIFGFGFRLYNFLRFFHQTKTPTLPMRYGTESR